MHDLEFISGSFLDLEIPKEKRYLLKYFTTDLQIAFLRYYLVFGMIENFVDHTGYYCHERVVYKLKDKYHRIVEAHDAAKSNFTEEGLEKLQDIESGNYVPRTGKKRCKTCKRRR